MWVITDGKLDDCLAVVILYKWMLESEGVAKEPTSAKETLNVVVTNIKNIEGCVLLLEHLLRDVEDFLKKNEQLSRVKFYEGQRGEEPKSHEEGLYDDKVLKPKTISQLTDEDIQNNPIGWLFALAPCHSLIKLLQTAELVFIGIGYNSSTLSFEQMNTLNLVMINNRDSYIDGEEGGRFDVEDNELWDDVFKISSRFKKIRKHALNDTRSFIARQMKKFGNKFGFDIDYDAVYHDPLTDDTLTNAKNIQEKVGPGTYLDRIVEQLERKVLQVECTDGQHMALWLSSITNAGFVEIISGEKGVKFKPSISKTKFRAYLKQTRSNTRDQFISMLKKF